jgi:UDP-glucose 4-epimerase
VRNFNTFGEYQSFDSYGGVIAKFTAAALKDEPLEIYGDGTQQRDYMYIADALQAYELMSTALAGSVVNFGSGKTVTVNEIAEWIKELTGSKSEIKHIKPRPGEVQRLCAGIAKARDLGFTPNTDFKADLERYIEWAKKR